MRKRAKGGRLKARDPCVYTTVRGASVTRRSNMVSEFEWDDLLRSAAMNTKGKKRNSVAREGGEE